MVDFFSGAAALSFVVAGGYFLRFWRKTGDRLFFSFAVAFWLLALNQTIAAMLGVDDARTGYAYLLRVIGFIVILAAIVGKNLSGNRKP